MLSWIKRWPRLSCILLVVGWLVATGAFKLARYIVQVSPAGFEQIRFGMTESEVEWLLGSDDPSSYSIMTSDEIDVRHFKFWHSFRGQEIRVGFNSAGQVTFKEFYPHHTQAYSRITVYQKKDGMIFDSRDNEEQ